MQDVSTIAGFLRNDGTLSDYIAGVLERSSDAGQTLTLNALQVRYARAMVSACRGNKSRAARVLGVSRRSLYRLLDREAA